MRPINLRCLSILLTFGCLYLSITAERDFQFNDELQVTLTEPQDEIPKVTEQVTPSEQQHLNSYSKVI